MPNVGIQSILSFYFSELTPLFASILKIYIMTMAKEKFLLNYEKLATVLKIGVDKKYLEFIFLKCYFLPAFTELIKVPNCNWTYNIVCL